MREEPTSVPFENFAQYYDQFMLRLVNYPVWVEYIIKIFKEHKLSPRTILDVACGTGIPSLLLAQKGYRIIGVDNSQNMLEMFKQKLSNSKYNIQLIHSNIRNFSLPEKVDVAVSFYDSINYLLTEQDLASCFSCVANSLKPSGVFTFDMNSEYCLAIFWGNRETPRKIGNISSIWQNSYDPNTRISTLKLTVFTPDGRAFQEIHKERAYSQTELKSILESVGFVNIEFYSHPSLLTADDTTLRIMIVARKPA